MLSYAYTDIRMHCYTYSAIFIHCYTYSAIHNCIHPYTCILPLFNSCFSFPSAMHTDKYQKYQSSTAYDYSKGKSRRMIFKLYLMFATRQFHSHITLAEKKFFLPFCRPRISYIRHCTGTPDRARHPSSPLHAL